MSLGLPTTDKERKAMELWTFLMEYFPDTFLAVFGVSKAGNDQHNPGQRLHWARHKSTDHMNTAFRHMWDYGRGVKKDTDGQYHLAKAIWRLSAELQLLIERDREEAEAAKGTPLPPDWDPFADWYMDGSELDYDGPEDEGTYVDPRS